MDTNSPNYLYFEITSRCAIKCPRCPRTIENITSFSDIDEETFTKIICTEKFQNLKFIEFGGNYGDPIYHPNLFRLIEIAKSLVNGVQIILHTNGAHRKKKWWISLVSILERSDIVLFSIDGLKNQNTMYRIGSDWKSVDAALNICAGKVTVYWKTIIFSFNEGNLLEIIFYAKSKGANYFLLAKSTRFGNSWSNAGVDHLRPTNPNFYQSTSTNRKNRLAPRCQSDSLFYIDPKGFGYRCTWLGLKPNNQFDYESCFKSKSINDLLSEESSEKFNQLLKSPDKFPEVCQRTCRADLSTTQNIRSNNPQLKLNLSLDDSILRENFNSWVEN